MKIETYSENRRRPATPIGLSIAIGSVLLLVLLLAFQSSASAAPGQTTWYVHPNGLDQNTGTLGLPFKTIQHAIDVAESGDTIIVAAGTYTENLVITESLTLRGGYSISGTAWLPPGPGETIINGSGGVSQTVIYIQDGGGAVELEGFIITGGDAANGGGGVTAGDVPLTLRKCVVRGNRVNANDSGGGIAGGNPLIIVDSFIVDNRLVSEVGPGETGGAGGVRVGPGSPVMMTNVVVAGNRGDAGVHVNGSLTLLNVTVSGNDGDVIFNPTHPATMPLTVTNTIIYGNAPHFLGCPQEGACAVNYSDIESGWTGGAGNISADPLFVNAGSGDYHLRIGSPCIDAGTPVGAPAQDIAGTARDGAPDMGAYEWSGFRLFLPLVIRNS